MYLPPTPLEDKAVSHGEGNKEPLQQEKRGLSFNFGEDLANV
jgi:hypothetical protein